MTSRAGAAKAAKEKAGKPSAPQTPVINTEIVPGKFTEIDWNNMLEKDSGEEYIFDLVDELLNNTMDAIYKLYIRRQLLPYTIAQAKDAILQIIEWQFLSRDDGEESVNVSGWLEDEEPDAAVTDCWAQGSVPKTEIAFAITPPFMEEATEEYGAPLDAKLEELRTMLTDPELEDQVSEAEVDAQEQEETRPVSAASTGPKSEQAPPPEQQKKKERVKYKPYRGKLKVPDMDRLTESLVDTEKHRKTKAKTVEMAKSVLAMPASLTSIVKAQAGRPPGNKEVEYDEQGNVVAVMKLDAEKLPNHRVTVKYTVVDPESEAAQARLDAMRRGRFMSAASKKKSGTSVKPIGMKPLGIRPIGIKPKVSGKKEPILSGKGKRKPLVTPMPPSLLESMDLAPGVTVTENGRTKKGPIRLGRKPVVQEPRPQDLHPVSFKIKSNVISVTDLLDRTTPILRPIDDTPPLPPIPPTPSIIT